METHTKSQKTNVNKGNGMIRIHPVVAGIIEEAIANHYVKRPRMPIRFICRLVMIMIDDENRNRGTDDKLRQPCYKTVYNRVKRRDRYDAIYREYRKRLSEGKFDAVKQGVHPTGPFKPGNRAC